MEKLVLDRRSLRKFGITMGIAFLVITFLILLRHKHSILITSCISLGFFAAAFIMPMALKYIYIFWMRLAFVLAWVNTRIILIFIFYLVFTPIGLVMKIFRKDLLERKIEKEKGSYWHIRPKKAFDPLNYERQF